MRKSTHRGLYWTLFLSALALSSARAGVISFVTPPDSHAGGESVAAQATFTTSANQIVVKLENLTVNPHNIVQCLSAFDFTVSTGEHSGTLASSLGMERTIDSDGSFDD